MFRLRHPLLYTFAENSKDDGSSFKDQINPNSGKWEEYKEKNFKSNDNQAINKENTTTTNPQVTTKKKVGRPIGSKNKTTTEVKEAVENSGSQLKKPGEPGSFQNPLKVSESTTGTTNQHAVNAMKFGSGRNVEKNREVSQANNVSSMLGVSDDDMTNAYTSYNAENNNNNNNNNGNGGGSGNGNGGSSGGSGKRSGGGQAQNQQPPAKEKSMYEKAQDVVGEATKAIDPIKNYINENQLNDVQKASENNTLDAKTKKKLDKVNVGDLKFEDKEALGKRKANYHESVRYLNNIKKGAGVQKWAAAGGAVLGAVGRYRQALKEWEYECQRAAAEGRPMPKKPSLLGSALVGGATGAIAGAGVGFVAKRMSSNVRNLDTALKNAGYNKNLAKTGALGQSHLDNKLEYERMTDNQFVAARRLYDEKTKKQNAKIIAQSPKKVNSIIDKKTWTSKDADQAYNYMHGLMDKGGLNELKNVLMTRYPSEINEKSSYDNILHFLQRWRNSKAAFFSMYDNLAYIGQCFSLVEELEEKANKDVEDWKELYNFYILNICDEPIPINDFLLECYYYPHFIEYVEDAIVNFYQKKLVTFSSLGGIQKELDQYQDLYNEYRNIVGTNLTATEFIDRCITYESYVKYIYDKIKRTRLRRLGAMHFANPQSTSLPQNIQIDGQNIDTTQQGLPDPKDANSMQNQNSIQNKQQDAKNRQAQLERQKQEQQKKQQIEINKANYAKEQHAKEVNEINKLTQKKAEISKNLGRNASDMPMQQLAEQKQKITDLNFKIQNVKAETKNKIANYKGKSSKQFSLRKPV